MILWHDCYSFSMDGSQVGWHPNTVPLILVLFLSFIISGSVRHYGVLWHDGTQHGCCEDEVIPIHLWFPFVPSVYMPPYCCFPLHVFFFKVVPYHIVVFQFFLPHLFISSSQHTSYECDIHLL